MRWISKLGLAQRVVVVVALGVAFLALGSFILSLGHRWVVSDTTATFTASSTDWPSWVHLITWLGLACLWAAVSIKLLRPSVRDE